MACFANRPNTNIVHGEIWIAVIGQTPSAITSRYFFKRIQNQMSELLYVLPIILLGIISGIVIGIFPGVGPASGILMLYPILIGLPVVDLFVFYSVMMSSVQYYSSIPSIV